MNKKQLITELKNRLNMPKDVIENNLDITIELLKEILFKGECIKIKNFGSFYFKQYKERLFYNPRTNLRTYLPPKKVIVFKCSKRLI